MCLKEFSRKDRRKDRVFFVRCKRTYIVNNKEMVS